MLSCWPLEKQRAVEESEASSGSAGLGSIIIDRNSASTLYAWRQDQVRVWSDCSQTFCIPVRSGIRSLARHTRTPDTLNCEVIHGVGGDLLWTPRNWCQVVCTSWAPSASSTMQMQMLWFLLGLFSLSLSTALGLFSLSLSTALGLLRVSESSS